jgi:hypothetical protein
MSVVDLSANGEEKLARADRARVYGITGGLAIDSRRIQ